MLKNIYQAITQSQQPRDLRKGKEPGSSVLNVKVEQGSGVMTGRSERKGEEGLIPLSMVGQGMGRSSSSGSVGVGRWRHGLMRGRE